MALAELYRAAQETELLTACKLWEKVSAKGNRYLIGRMGGVRVMVMTNSRPEDENDASHVLIFAEAPAYSPSQATPAATPSPSTPVRRRVPRNGKTQHIDDDPVPFSRALGPGTIRSHRPAAAPSNCTGIKLTC